MGVQHVVVLCLENRSFDHMLGYLDHPDPAFCGLRTGSWSNPDAAGTPIPPTSDATSVLPYGPDHAHNAVMQQLALTGPLWNQTATQQGFVASYERKAAGLDPPRYAGLFGWAYRLLRRPAPGTAGRGALIMRCQTPERVPVLATLAREFAVFDHWYCSVPGETWPNRNFLHAATSDGETNIAIRPYTDATIFDLLECHGCDWRIYHDGVAQAMAFPWLWDAPERHAKWYPMSDFASHVRAGDLPGYTFIEPRHQPPDAPLDQLQAAGAVLGTSNSQHPENNLVDNAAFDHFTPTTPTDFDRGEQLLAGIYEALRANPDLFATTVLLVTYDEHGGFYDHLPAPERVQPPGDPIRRLARVMNMLYRQSAATFDFTRLGVRVPTVAISPLIASGTLVPQVYEHASLPATLRKLFAPDAAPLTHRDAHARTFEHLWHEQPVRTDLPDLSAYTGAAHRAEVSAAAAEPGQDRPPASTPTYYHEFLAQADAVRQHLHAVGEPEVAPLTDPTTARSEDPLTDAFDLAAQRHRAADPTDHSGDSPASAR